MSSPALAPVMQTSSAAALVVERARRLRPSPSPLTALNRPGRALPAAPSIVADSDADVAHDDGTAIHAHLRIGTPVATVAFPHSNDGARTMTLRSGSTISLRLSGATSAEAEFANGFVVYRAGLSAGGDVIVRPTRDGFEDHFVFDRKPANATVEYVLALPPAVAGLRLASNVLELLDAAGTPLVHASPPILVDAAGKTVSAVVSVSGCAIDASSQPPWRRRPTRPGATSCRVAIKWDDSTVQYPAVLDPNWSTAGTMPVAVLVENVEVLRKQSPQQVVVIGGSTATTGAIDVVQFFDVDSGTWSVGPPVNVGRGGATSTYFNTNGASDGDKVFLAGGDSLPDANTVKTEASTEILSVDSAGHWQWSFTAPMQTARFAHTATLLGTRILLAGGWTVGGSATPSCEFFDTTTAAFVSPPPPDMLESRADQVAAILPDGQSLLVADGYDTNVNHLSTTEIFTGGKWVQAPPIPGAPYGPSTVALKDGRIMFAGGWHTADGSQGATEVALFTFSAVPPYGTWTSAEPFGVQGGDGTATLMGNGAVLLGPMSTANPSPPPTATTQVHLYDPMTGHWSDTNTVSPHRGGGSVTATKRDGTVETIVFGGATVASANGWTLNGITEIFTPASTGNGCTVGPNCVTGICESGLCVPQGFPLTIDATALSNKGLVIVGFSSVVLDTTQPRQLRLPAGTYGLQVYAGLASSASFTVKPDGTIDYDASLEGVLSGRGTSALKINGRRITVQTRLSQTQLALLAYHYNQGSETDQLPFTPQTPQAFVLLPVPSFGYQFDVGGATSNVADLQFSIDVAGNVHIPTAQSAIARGEGTTTLLIEGFHVSIAMPPSLGDGNIAGVDLPSGKTTDVYVLPVNGGTLSFQIGGHSGTLGVTSAGDLTGDLELLNVLQIHGDNGPFCSSDTTDALANAWNLTPLTCNGVPEQNSTGYIDAPTPVPTIAARLTGANRAPNQLPRYRRPAGGDPVLGDGEFLIDRVDASLAGYGIHYEFRRSYRSGLENDGPLSPGWDHNYDQRIIGRPLGDPQSPRFDPTIDGDYIGTNCDGTVQYQDGEGNLQLFGSTHWESGPGGEAIQYFSGQNGDLQLEFHWIPFNSSIWRLTRADGTVTIFDHAGFLASINDPAGNSLSFSWDRATAPPPPRSDCAAGGYNAPGCAAWLYSLTNSPIGQRRRLAMVTDASRTVYYVYSQTNPQNIYPNDRLKCISLENDCTANVLASFSYDPSGGQLVGVSHGAVGTTAFETYKYHAAGSDSPYCVASADLPNYCHRLCDPNGVGASCENLNYEKQAADKCGNALCNKPGAGCDGLAEPFTIRRGTGIHAPTICCSSLEVGNPDDCRRFLFGGPTCVDGCESMYQCQEVVNNTRYAFYAGGVARELNNDITDVYDNKGGLVVHNDYGEDRSLVSFDKVTKQQLASASTDNTISFEYHDLLVEAMTNGPPVYTGSNGATPATTPYSTPDANVQKYFLTPDTVIDLCPRLCPGGAATCSTYDYGPATQTNGIEFNPGAMTSAVVIHDLHGRTRIQYLDQTFMVRREVALDTDEISDFTYVAGLVSGARAASGVRSCIEHDARGRVTQSSVVPAAGYNGSTVTQATTFAYGPSGLVSDVARDVFGSIVKTHYERDAFARVYRVDQDVRAGAPPLQTFFSYDGESPPAGVLETPTQITYPNGRVDKFSQFHPTMGGPQHTVIDATSATPEQRFAHYDTFGRVTMEGEINRFAQRYDYSDPANIWRVSSVGHSLDTVTWIDVPVQSHVVDGETVIDSEQEAARTTTFTNVGRYPMQKDLVATKAPPGTTALPATQTSCYNYAPDGRLDAAILPEGNGVKYSYFYNVNGSYVVAQKGFGVDTTGAWAAGCGNHTVPQNDPGLSTPAIRQYYPGGFLAREMDENLVQRSFTTDGFGRVLQIQSMPDAQHPDAVATQQFGYDTAGHRIWEVSRTPGAPYGRPSLPDATVLSYVEYDYDLAGRVIAQRAHVIETGEVLTKTVAYDDVAGTQTITDRGSVTTMAYDGRGRLLSTTAPDGSITRIVHGLGVDTATVQSNSKGNIVRTFDYDTRGLLLNVQTAAGQVLYQATYDDDANQLTERRAGLGPVTWAYDSFGRVATETRTISTTPTATVATSVYQYDRNDRVIAYFDAENSGVGGIPWQMTFTGGDAPLTVKDPLQRIGTYTYSNANNWPHTLAQTVQEPNGRVSSFGYDSQARLIDVYNGPCPTTRNTWDCNGVLTSQRHMAYDTRGDVVAIAAPKPRVPVALTYDSIGRLIDEKVGVDSDVRHTFLDQGRTQQTQVFYGASMATMTHRYDNMDRLHTVELAGQATPLAIYDFGVGAGGPLSLAYSNGATAAYSYDDKLRQIGIDVTFKQPGTNTSTFVTSLHEAFGTDSIPRMRQHKIGNKPAVTDVFQVDQDGRISGENLLVPGITLPSGEIGNGDVTTYMQKGANWRQYDIDKIGNIKKVTTRNSTLLHEIDKLSRLTKLGTTPVMHDATDNLNGKQSDPVQFKFDQFTGTPACVGSAAACNSGGAGTTTFTYDALDRRRLEHRPDGTDHVYVWDGNQLVGHGTADGMTLDVPGDDIDAHIVSIDQFGTGAQWFYHQGPDQSALAVTGSAGLVEAYSYSAFGELAVVNAKGNSISQSAFGNIFQYQGHVFDAATATYSMRARQYQPAWGSFSSPDPLSWSGGSSLYAFTGSQSLQHRDPLGLEPEIVKLYGPRTPSNGTDSMEMDFTTYYATDRDRDPSGGFVNIPIALGGGGPVADATSGGPMDGDARKPASLRRYVGTIDYYRRRNQDFLRRHPQQKPPSYYLHYGDKYAQRFMLVLRPHMTIFGQRWADAAFRLLQLAMEDRRDENPMAFDALEQEDGAFRDFAYGTHPDAYIHAGLAKLPITDLVQIAETPDFKDSLTLSGIEQALTTARDVLPDFVALRTNWMFWMSRQYENPPKPRDQP